MNTICALGLFTLLFPFFNIWNEDDQQEWLDRYENDSMYDDLSRDESYFIFRFM